MQITDKDAFVQKLGNKFMSKQYQVALSQLYPALPSRKDEHIHYDWDLHQNDHEISSSNDESSCLKDTETLDNHRLVLPTHERIIPVPTANNLANPPIAVPPANSPPNVPRRSNRTRHKPPRFSNGEWVMDDNDNDDSGDATTDNEQ